MWWTWECDDGEDEAEGIRGTSGVVLTVASYERQSEEDLLVGSLTRSSARTMRRRLG